MNGIGTVIALAVLLAYTALRPPTAAPVHAPATPMPSALPEDIFGGIEQPGSVPVSMLIQNHGTSDDCLLGVSTPAASRVELHQTRLQHGQREMQPLPWALSIPAGKSLVLEPGATHLMLMELTEGLVQGRSFPLTLHFARAGDVTVAVRVRRKVGAAGLATPSPVTADDLTISLASAPPASPLRP